MIDVLGGLRRHALDSKDFIYLGADCEVSCLVDNRRSWLKELFGAFGGRRCLVALLLAIGRRLGQCLGERDIVVRLLRHRRLLSRRTTYNWGGWSRTD
jgi:hypothetical protein